MTVHQLTRTDARRIAVRAQLLDRSRPADLLDLVRQLTDYVRELRPHYGVLAIECGRCSTHLQVVCPPLRPGRSTYLACPFVGRHVASRGAIDRQQCQKWNRLSRCRLAEAAFPNDRSAA